MYLFFSLSPPIISTRAYLAYTFGIRLSSGLRHLPLTQPSRRLERENREGDFVVAPPRVSLSRLSPTFLVAHGRRGERTRARFRGVAHQRASEWRGEGRGCSQSVPKTFTIARLGSLALALSLGLCLMAYLPMWVAHNTKMYGCAGRGPAWSLTHLLPYSIAKPKAYSVPNAERTDVPSRSMPVVFGRHFVLSSRGRSRENRPRGIRRPVARFRSAGRRSAPRESREEFAFRCAHVGQSVIKCSGLG